MKINLDNYEIYFVDYYDDKLIPEQVDELKLFLTFHPELEEEFISFGDMQNMMKIEDTICLSEIEKKNLISIPEQKPSFTEEDIIAYCEGDLDSEKYTQLLSAMNQDPELKKLQLLHSQLHVSPDMSIVFTEKSHLKRHFISPAIQRSLVAISSVAAMVLLFFALYTPSTKENASFAVVSENQIFPLDHPAGAFDSDTIEPFVSPKPQTPLMATQNDPRNQSVPEFIPASNKVNQLAMVSPDLSGIDVRTQEYEVYKYMEMRLKQRQQENHRKNSRLNAGQFLYSQAYHVVSGENVPASRMPEKVGISDIANLGITGISELTGTNIPLAIK